MIAVAEKIRNDNYIYFNLFMYFHKQDYSFQNSNAINSQE